MKKIARTGRRIGLCIVLAVCMTVAAVLCLKGPDGIRELVSSVTGGRLTFDPDTWNGIGAAIQNSLDTVEYDIKDAVRFSEAHEILSGDVERYCPGEAPERLLIQAGGCELTVSASEDGSLYLEASGVGKLQAYQEGDRLIVRTTTASREATDTETAQVRLYLPENAYYSEAEAELGAGLLKIDALTAGKIVLKADVGKIEAKGLTAEELAVSAGAGNLEAEEINVRKLTATLGAGGMTLSGSVTGDAALSCAMGNLKLLSDGSETDFNYLIAGNVGTVTLAGESYSGVDIKRELDNGSAQNMEITCNMGTVTVGFR